MGLLLSSSRSWFRNEIAEWDEPRGVKACDSCFADLRSELRVYIDIYWNNHHHLLHATQRVNGATLLANLHLLFWLSHGDSSRINRRYAFALDMEHPIPERFLRWIGRRRLVSGAVRAG